MKNTCVHIIFAILIMASGNDVLYGQQSATINIDLLQPTQDTISKRIYGGFIEFIFDVINGHRGLWAQEIRNRGFDVADNIDSTIAQSWLKYNTGTSSCNWELDSSGYNPNGVYSQKVSVSSFISGKYGIAQKQVYLKSGIQYNFYTYLKGVSISGSVNVSLLDTNQQIIDSINLNSINSNWQKYSGVLSSNYDGDAMLTISFQEQGDLWIDEISLMPSTAVDGVRGEYISPFQVLNPTILRYPGGCFADGAANFWEFAIGDIDKRKSPNWDNNWGAYQRMDFGLHEYIQFCNNTGIEPQITVNFGTRDSVDARNLVEYCNSDSTTFYGSLRKLNGSALPFNIKYWEIGNEQYGTWEIGHTTAVDYATRFKGFSNLMKAVDPTIKIIANGDNLNLTWTDTLLLIAGNNMDLISIHQGIPYIYYNDTLYTDQQVYEAMVASPIYFKKGVEKIEQLLSNYGLNNVDIALTEWWEDYACLQYQPHGNSLETAVYAACLLNVLQQKSYIIKLANRTTFIEILKEDIAPFSFYLSPSSYVLSMYNYYSGDNPVNHSVICPFDSSSAVAGLPAQDTVPLLDVSVTKNVSKIFINVVNRSLSDTISTTINLQSNYTSYQATVRSIRGNSFLTNNNTNHTNITMNLDSMFMISGNTFNYVFPPLSVTGIELNTSVNVEQNISNPNKINIFPNPANQTVTVNFTTAKPENIEMIITDLNGKIVKTIFRENYQPGNHSVNIDVQNYETGNYFLTMRIGEALETRKFAVIK